jgi:hypothetical protein
MSDDLIGGIKTCKHGNMINDLNFCELCGAISNFEEAIKRDREWLIEQKELLEYKVAELEKRATIKYVDELSAEKCKLEAMVTEMEALVLRIAEKECMCTFVQRLNGDGCEVCNPKQAIELIKEANADE